MVEILFSQVIAINSKSKVILGIYLQQKYKRFRLSSGLFRYYLNYSRVNFRLTGTNEAQKQN